MKKIIITGCSGFVAKHYIRHILETSADLRVIGISRHLESASISNKIGSGVQFVQLDLMEYDRLRNLITEVRPDYVLHLASFSSVAYSWNHPTDSFVNNCNIFLNLINAIREADVPCRILSVGSSEEYGNVTMEDLPIDEDLPLKPLSPYAVARVSQEMLAKCYVDAYGMEIIMTRSFNHIGPGQDERFVIPSFIKRILDIREKGYPSGVIETGDLTIIRDFVDVRDVVTAYELLLNRGQSGEVYNVCSGEGHRLRDIVDRISKEVGVEVVPHVNPDYVRPNECRTIIGSPRKMINTFEWSRKYVFDQTIHDMITEQAARGRSVK